MLNTLLSHIDDPRDIAIVLLIADCKLKLSDVQALEIDHIKWHEQRIKIPNKWGKYATLTPRTESALKEALAARETTTTPHLFLTQKGDSKALSTRGIDHIIRSYGEKAGLGTLSARRLLNINEETDKADEEPTPSTHIQINKKQLALASLALLGLAAIHRLLRR